MDVRSWDLLSQSEPDYVPGSRDSLGSRRQETIPPSAIRQVNCFSALRQFDMHRVYHCTQAIESPCFPTGAVFALASDCKESRHSSVTLGYTSKASRKLSLHSLVRALHQQRQGPHGRGPLPGCVGPEGLHLARPKAIRVRLAGSGATCTSS